MVDGLIKTELKEFLDEKVYKYNQKNFIDSDPIQVPHSFNKKEDIEISSFLTSIIAWGQRKTIINNSFKMMEALDYSPHDFILNASEKEINKLKIIHRTFNEIDFRYFIRRLKIIYENHKGLESFFMRKQNTDNLHYNIHDFKKFFFHHKHPKRTTKHISDPLKGSACKRINMFLRWMVRKDNIGVDFGIWKKISPSVLSCPLDIHTGNVGRKLGLIARKQNDIKAVIELDKNLKKMDPNDPVKYDYALFGLGVFEGF